MTPARVPDPPGPVLDHVHDATLGAAPSVRNVLLGAGECVHEESAWAPGRSLCDAEWLERRIDDTARRWSCDDREVAATLWWYSASATLVAVPVAALFVTASATDPDPARLRITLRRNGHVGYLARVRSDRLLPGGAGALGAALLSLAPVVDLLADLGGANRRSLWSVLGDSLAGRFLTVAQELDRADLPELTRLARTVTGATRQIPSPRYAVARDADREVPFVRRGSCCLILHVPAHGRCGNCPRQTPSERSARVLAAHP